MFDGEYIDICNNKKYYCELEAFKAILKTSIIDNYDIVCERMILHPFNEE
jgi:hypothetical protein